jgi:hypothetical protein
MSLSTFADALDALLQAGEVYRAAACPTAEAYADLRTIFEAARLRTPPGLALPPLEEAGLPVNEVEPIPALWEREGREVTPLLLHGRRYAVRPDPAAWQRWAQEVRALRDAARLAPPETPPPPPGAEPEPRPASAPGVACDVDTQTVTLDGAAYKVTDPKAFALYRAIVDNRPQPLTRAQLRQRVRGCGGKKTVRNALDRLPPEVRATVKSGPGGFWFDAGEKGST